MPGLDGKISLSLSSKRAQSTLSSGLKRSRGALDEDDHHDHDYERGKSQSVSHFDASAGGGIDQSRPSKGTGLLIIKPQANRDWKDAASGTRKRQKSALPSDQPKQQQGDIKEQEIEALERAKTLSSGLTVRRRDSNAFDDIPASHDGIQSEPDTNDVDTPVEPANIRTLEEQAIDALVGNETSSPLVLSAIKEDEALQRDLDNAPEMSTLEDYARVPIDQFGAALLRGMGWKDGEGIGNQRGQKLQKTTAPTRRPALLGIGAKEEAAITQELGAWGKAARKGGEVKIYNPVLIRDKKTGQLFTDEELQRKKEMEERARYEHEYEHGGNAKNRRRRGERESSRDRSRRDIRSSTERSHRSHRDGDDARSDRRREDVHDERRHHYRRRERDYDNYER